MNQGKVLGKLLSRWRLLNVTTNYTAFEDKVVSDILSSKSYNSRNW
jgi:hypothetical protein